MNSVVEAARRIGGHPRLEPFTALLLRAWCVRESAAFLARELARRRVVASYRVRGRGGGRLLLRHRTGDVVTLGEVFHRPDYEPPPEVAAMIPPAPRIVDLGANVGYFGLYAFGCWPDASIEAYEPDPDNAALLERCIALNGLSRRWRAYRAAAGVADGVLTFKAGLFATSRAALPGERGAIDVPIVDILPALEGRDLLKMDIEGGEWAILSDDRFMNVRPPVMVFEYHPHLCPSPDPAATVARRLAELGCRTHTVFARPDGHGQLWAWTT
jgi:FkbM family methyltransferase